MTDAINRIVNPRKLQSPRMTVGSRPQVQRCNLSCQTSGPALGSVNMRRMPCRGDHASTAAGKIRLSKQRQPGSVSFSEAQYQKLLTVIEHLNGGIDSRDVRERAGMQVLDLLKADYFASYVWSPDERQFGDHVFINMDPDNLQRYHSYYQFHDPITGHMQRYRRAVSVNEVMPQDELVGTEFYNDFLRNDGLYYGVNLFVYDGDENIGDMRIWRSRHRENFQPSDLQLLDLLKPHFCNAMKNIRAQAGHARVLRSDGASEVLRTDISVHRLRTAFALTAREAQISLEIVHGKTDRQIAEALCISHSTTRTHINRIFQKLGVHNRASLIRNLTNT